MNLADTLSGLTNYYADALEGCGRPVCSALRYVGNAELLGAGACDCTCDATSDLSVEPEAGYPQGTLRVGWQIIGPSEKPPTLATMWSGAQFGVPLVQVHVRVMRCWPTKEGLPVSAWDTAAAGVADDAWCLTVAAQKLIVCRDQAAREALGVEGCNRVGGYRIEPILPLGACVGTALTMYVQLSA